MNAVHGGGMTPSNLITLVAITVAFLFGVRSFWPAGPLPLYQAVSLAVAAVAFCFFAAARIQLGQSFSVAAKAKHLVTTGIYSRIRNPIYVFGGLLIAAFLVFIGRPVFLLAFVVLIPVQIVRARAESRVLEETFGEEYRAYKARTWF
jgi:protein-S-isoprenylcysteine O-methyltransferase Ste14